MSKSIKIDKNGVLKIRQAESFHIFLWFDDRKINSGAISDLNRIN